MAENIQVMWPREIVCRLWQSDQELAPRRSGEILGFGQPTKPNLTQADLAKHRISTARMEMAGS